MKKLLSVVMAAAMFFALAVTVHAASQSCDVLADADVSQEGTISVVNLAESNELFEVLVGSSWRVISGRNEETLPIGNYTVRIVLSLNRSGVNQHHVEIPNVPTGTVLNRNDYVHTVTVPQGITVRSIGTLPEPDREQRATVLTRGIPASGITAGNTLDLPISGRTVRMVFSVDGIPEEQTLDFVLNGSNPFAGAFVIIDFPGVERVAVEYFRSGSGTPIRVPGAFDSRATFMVPANQTLNTVRVTRGVQVSLTPTHNDWAHRFCVPVGTISMANLVGHDGAFQVLLGSSWFTVGRNEITLFEGNYTARFGVSLNGSGGSLHEITAPNVPTGTVIDRNLYVHTVTVPKGVVVRSIVSPGARGTVVTNGIPQNGITAGSALDLPISGRNATMVYLCNGEARTLEFVLDGSNPFNSVCTDAGNNPENGYKPENGYNPDTGRVPNPPSVGVSNAQFVSVTQTWTVTFSVDKYANGTTSTYMFNFTFNGDNANQSGSYTFASDHPLAGYTITYDIRGNGSSTRVFSISKD